jgi:hypothetical protein
MASKGSSYDQLPFKDSNMLALLTKEINFLILAQVGMNMRLSQDMPIGAFTLQIHSKRKKERERERKE